MNKNTLTKTEIAEMFSHGNFEKIIGFLADDAEWTVIEEDHFVGKEAIINQCKLVSNYFKSVTTNFKTINILTDEKQVAITGTAEFLKDNTRISFISACDIYEFNGEDQIQKITSYCVHAK